MKKIDFLHLKSLKILVPGSGSASGSASQRYGSEDPDSHTD
jgi:hypothetical protein